MRRCTAPEDGRWLALLIAVGKPGAAFDPPAGTFDTFRAECAASNDSQDTDWVAASLHPFVKTQLVRGPKHPSGPGTQDTALVKLPS